MGVLDRIKAASKIKKASIMSASSILTEKEQCPTEVPALNIAFSGKVDGGFTPGLTLISGASKCFKTLCSLLCAKSYMDRYPEAGMVFYDSEMGASQSYFLSLGIDLDRVLHVPVTNVEELKFDISKTLNEVQEGERLVIVVDSIGNLASVKEVEDALNEKSVADMSRAKSIKSLTRIITPLLNLKNIPCFMIAHVYQDVSSFIPSTVISGGCLAAGTEIQMADGSLKKINEINVDELVKTPIGDCVVTAAWNPDTLDEGEPECYEIEFEDGFVVTCSDKHKFIVDGEWVEASSLNVDQLVKTTQGDIHIVRVEAVGRKPVYDISVDKAEQYVLANGVITHNTGLMYSCDQAIIITRSQEKKGTELVGWNFNMTIAKSRSVREKTRIPLTVTFDNGVLKWSGLLDMALASGHVIKPSNGWYQRVNKETGEVEEKKWRAADTNCAEFWNPVLSSQSFKTWVEGNFKVAYNSLLAETNDDVNKTHQDFVAEE